MTNTPTPPADRPRLRVYRYPVPVTTPGEAVAVDLPRDARIVRVGAQPHRGAPFVVWAEVNPHAPLQRRQFTIVPTGQDVDPGWAHVGSYGTNDNEYVWHAYEITTTPGGDQ